MGSCNLKTDEGIRALRKKLSKVILDSNDLGALNEGIKSLLNSEEYQHVKDSIDELESFIDAFHKTTLLDLLRMKKKNLALENYNNREEAGEFIRTFVRKTVPDSGENGSKTDKADGFTNDSFIKDQATFIYDKYGGSSAARADMDRRFTYAMAGITMFNRKRGTEINTQKDLNESIATTLEDLYTDIREGLIAAGEVGEKDLPKSLFAKGAVEKLDKLAIIQNFKGLKPAGVNYFFESSKSNKKELERYKHLMPAFLSWFILTNFDKLIAANYPGVFEIDGRYFGQIRNPQHDESFNGKTVTQSKYHIKLDNHNLGVSWSSDEELSDAIGEASDIVRIFWNSQMLLNYDGTPQRNLTMKEIASTWTSIKDAQYGTDKIPFSLLENMRKHNKNDENVGITESEYDYLTHKVGIRKESKYSLGELITKSRTEPRAMRILFKLLSLLEKVDYDPESGSINSRLRSKQKQIIFSIYRQVFAPNNTLYEAYIKNGKDETVDLINKKRNYYTYITQFFNSLEKISMTQYKINDDGTYRIITLGESSLDNYAMNYQRTIGTKFSASLDWEDVKDSGTTIDAFINEKESTHDTFKVDRSGLGESSRDKKHIRITLSDGKVLVVDSSLRVGFEKPGSDKSIPIDPTSDLSKQSGLLDFVKSALNLKAFDDTKMKSLLNEAREQGLTTTDLVELAGNILYSYAASRESLKEETDRDFKQKARSFFSDDEKCRVERSGYDLVVFANQNSPKVMNLLRAIDNINGVSRDTVTKGADGAMINQMTTSQQVCKANEQHLRHKMELGEDYACKGFEELDAITGFEIARDVKKGQENQKVTEFTPAENFAYNFVCDFVDAFNGDRRYDKGIVRILPMVVSDKVRVIKLKFDTTKETDIPVDLENEDGPTKRVSYANMTPEEINWVAKKRLGDFYEFMYNRINSQWETLSSYITPSTTLNRNSFSSDSEFEDTDFLLKTIQANGIKAFSLESNFAGINNAINDLITYLTELKLQETKGQFLIDKEKKNIDSRAKKAVTNLMHTLQVAAQRDGKEVEIVENSFYCMPKKGAPKFLVNPGLVDQLYRWGKRDEDWARNHLGTYKRKVYNKTGELVEEEANLIESSHTYGGKDFFRTKNLQLLSDILQDNGYVSLRDTHGRVIQSGAMKILGDLKHEGVDKAWSQDGKVALGAIYYQDYDANGDLVDRVINITDKSQLKEIGLVKSIFNFVKYHKNPSLFNGTNIQYIRDLYSSDDWVDNPYFSFSDLEVFAKAFFEQLDRERSDEAFEQRLYEDKLQSIQSNINDRVSKLQETRDRKIAQLEEQKNNTQDLSLIDRINSEIENLNEDYDQKIINQKQLGSERIKKATEKHEKRIAERSIYKTANRKSGDVYFEIKINPMLEKFNALHFVASQEYIISDVGTHLNHPGIGNLDKGLQAFESLCWAQQVKRNVTQTASKHEFNLNHLNTLPLKVNIAIITNLGAGVYNIYGVEEDVLNDDGAMYVCGVTNILENQSLGADAVGVDKKQFFHQHNGTTGTGYIGKCAGFSTTNLRIRNSNVHYRIINRRMLEGTGSCEKWLAEHGKLGLDITKNYRGKNIIFGPIQYKKVYFERKDGQLVDELPMYEVIDGTVSEQPVSPLDLQNAIFDVVTEGENDISYDENTGRTKFSALVTKTNENGETVTKLRHFLTTLKNAFDVWMFFGGESSGTIREGNKMFEEDFNERSFEQTTELCNQLGELLNDYGDEDSDDQLNVNQYLKKSIIHYMPTIESVKQGPANVNDTTKLGNSDYALTTMVLDLCDAGVQLNAEHHSDESVLSMMTQVLNALGARGFTANEADDTYQALRGLTAIALSDYLDSIDYSKAGDEAAARRSLESFISFVIGNTIKANGALDQGTLAGALMVQAQRAIQLNNGKLDFETIRRTIPIDDQALLRNMMSKIASGLVKSCVKIKFPGTMDVLSPSNGIYRLYNGHMLSHYHGRMKDLYNEDNRLIAIDVSQIKIGRTYRITGFPDGEVFEVKDPKDYWKVKDHVKAYPNSKITEVVSAGRDLAGYNVMFKIQGSDKEYCLWDIDEIKTLYETANGDKNPELMRKLQEAMAALSKDPNYKNVTIDGQPVVIDKSSVKEECYEIIMSMLYKKQFGLKAGDEVKDIVEDKTFFLKRQIETYKSNLDEDYFDIELKRVNGEHVYIAYDDGRTGYPEGFEPVNIIPYTDEKGNIAYYNHLGKKIMNISSTEDKILSNAQGQTIIYTKNPEFFIDNVKHTGFSLSMRLARRDSELLQDFFDKHLSLALNRQAKTFVKRYTDFINGKEGFDDLENYSGNSIGGNIDLSSFRELLDLRKEQAVNKLGDFIKEGRKRFIEQEQEVKRVLENKTLSSDGKLAELESLIKAKKITNTNLVRLIQGSRELHTSFLKSLKILAARIPAQSMQSFMAMRVAGFDSSDLNTAYVSRFQIYLQGSDFDIDKVSLLGFKLKDGYFVKWSDLMDLSSEALLNASENIPFPTGRRFGIIEDINQPSNLFDEQLGGSILVNNEDGTRTLVIDGQEVLRISEPNDEELIEESELEQTEEENNENPEEPKENTTSRKVYTIYPINISDTNSFQVKRVLEKIIPTGAFVQVNGDENTANLISEYGFSIDKETGNFIKDGSNVSLAEDFYTFVKENPDLFTVKKGKYTIDLEGKDEATKIVLINKLAKFIRTVDFFEGIPALDIEGDEEDVKDRKRYNDSIESILTVINDHNTYTLRNKSLAEDALVNFISTSMYNISKNPINLIQAQSSVDAGESASNLIKNEAKKSDYAIKLLRYDPGSVTSVYDMMALTLGGKSNTGIVASSMKVFEGLSQYTYNILNNGTADEMEYLLMRRKICGHAVKLIANARQQNKLNFLPYNILEALDEVDQMMDAYLSYSGFLSLSTDNAKDPTLAKINAGQKMIGLYLAGVTMGVSIPNLIKVLTSKPAMLMAELMSKNMFNHDAGLFDVKAVIRYLNNGPSELLVRIPSEVKDKLKNYVENIVNEGKKDKDKKKINNAQLRQYIIDNPDEILKEIDRLIAEKTESISDFERALSKELGDEQAEDKLRNTSNNEDEIANNKRTYYGYKELRSRINRHRQMVKIIKESLIQLDDDTWVNPFSEIKKLGYMLNEMRRFSQVTRLNQDLPNTLAKQLDWIHKFERGISERIDEISRNEKSLHPEMSEAIDEFKELSQGTKLVDFIEFVLNKEYRDKIISIYGRLKYGVNVYDAMCRVKHYFGYMEALAGQFKGNETMSDIYRIAKDISYNIKILGDERTRERKLSKLVDWISDSITEDFLLKYNGEEGLVIRVNGRIYTPTKNIEFKLSKDPKANVPIIIGTPAGNMTFKRIMEMDVIPRLLKKFPDNKLLQDINIIKTDNTVDRNVLVKLATDSSTIPQNEYEDIRLAEYKRGLDLLANEVVEELGGRRTGLTFLDALFLYNLIVNKGKVTQTSFTNIFEEYAIGQGKVFDERGDSKSSSLIEAYYNHRKVKLNQFKDSALENPDSAVRQFEMISAEEVLISDLENSRSEYAFVKDPETRSFVLVEKITPVSEEERQYLEEYGENNDEGDDSDSGYIPEEIYDEIGGEPFEKRVLKAGYRIIGRINNVRTFNTLAPKLNKEVKGDVPKAQEILDTVVKKDNDGNFILVDGDKEITFEQLKDSIEHKERLEGISSITELLQKNGIIDADGKAVPTLEEGFVQALIQNLRKDC